MTLEKRIGTGLKKHLRLETLEDRRMLASMADIVFLFDESASGSTAPEDWLQQVVTGDLNFNNMLDPGESSLFDQLSAQGIDGVRYGLVGFAEDTEFQETRYAHSQLFPTSSLTGDPSQLTTTELNTVFDGLQNRGGDEDGWDAIEHAIAEYDFRDGAVPIIVLVQNEEGRMPLNRTLTRDGIFVAL